MSPILWMWAGFPICCSLPPLWRKIPSIRWAAAIVAEAQKQSLSLLPVEDFVSEPGKGIRGRIKGKIYLAGNQKIIEENGVDIRALERPAARLAEEGKPPCFLPRMARPSALLPRRILSSPPAPRQWLSGRLWASTW